MPEFFQHCPGCGARFHLKLEDTKMVHLERETYRRTETTSPGAAIGGTSGGARFGLNRPILVTEGPPRILYIEDFQYTYKCQHCGHVWTERHEETRSEPSLTPSKRARAPLSRLVIALLIIGLVVTASILGSAYAFHWFGNSRLSCGGSTGANSGYVRFTIVMSELGYNDSYYRSPAWNYSPRPPWPIMNLTIDSNVLIHVLNNDPSRISQTHGFAIRHYFEQGIALQPGECFNLTFIASTSGSFPVYSTIHDSVEAYEQAQLNVNP